MRKKILYIHHSGEMGGAPRSLAFLLQKLDKQKYDPVVLTVRQGQPVKLFEDMGAKVFVEDKLQVFHGSTVSGMSLKLFLKNVLYAYPTYFRAMKIIKKIKPDLIHLNSTCLFMFAKAARKIDKNIKIIAHVREPLLDNFAGNILRYMNHKYVDAFIGIDKYDLSKVNTKGRYSKVVYNFVDFDEYNSNIKSSVLYNELGLTKESVIILYLARVAEYNGTLEFVKMAKQYLQKNNNIHFVILGYKKNDIDLYTQEVINQCVNNKNLHVLEFRSDVPQVIASSHILVCPFTKPHFSRAIIEAAAMGVPSIATDIGGPNELVVQGETGFLYDVNSEAKFLEYLDKLIQDNQLRARMGENAKQFAQENFNSNINAQSTFEVYEELLIKNKYN